MASIRLDGTPSGILKLKTVDHRPSAATFFSVAEDQIAVSGLEMQSESPRRHSNGEEVLDEWGGFIPT